MLGVLPLHAVLATIANDLTRLWGVPGPNLHRVVDFKVACVGKAQLVDTAAAAGPATAVLPQSTSVNIDYNFVSYNPNPALNAPHYVYEVTHMK